MHGAHARARVCSGERERERERRGGRGLQMLFYADV